MNINFCTTACVRPELLKQTYKSFNNYLKGVQLKDNELFINIDPVPENNQSKIKEIMDISNYYFKKVIVNKPVTANFTQAVKWCWENANTEFIIHIEDDWVLEDVIDVEKAINNLKVDYKIMQFVFRAYEYRYKRIVLSPSIIKKQLYKFMAEKLIPSRNPEMQLHVQGKIRGREAENILTYPKEKIIVKDIGRPWLKLKGLNHGDRKYTFVKWHKDN